MVHGDRIKEARKNKGLTQEQLATAIGVKRAVISKYETGLVTPSVEQIEKIARELNISVGQIMGWPEPTEAEKKKFLEEYQPIFNRVEKAMNHLQEEIKPYNLDNPASLPTYDMIAEKELLEHFSALNLEGKIKAIERVEELSKIPDYQKDKIL